MRAEARSSLTEERATLDFFGMRWVLRQRQTHSAAVDVDSALGLTDWSFERKSVHNTRWRSACALPGQLQAP